jgi:hypothetical protein
MCKKDQEQQTGQEEERSFDKPHSALLLLLAQCHADRSRWGRGGRQTIGGCLPAGHDATSLVKPNQTNGYDRDGDDGAQILGSGKNKQVYYTCKIDPAKGQIVLAKQKCSRKT